MAKRTQNTKPKSKLLSKLCSFSCTDFALERPTLTVVVAAAVICGSVFGGALKLVNNAKEYNTQYTNTVYEHIAKLNASQRYCYSAYKISGGYESGIILNYAKDYVLDKTRQPLDTFRFAQETDKKYRELSLEYPGMSAQSCEDLMSYVRVSMFS